MPRHVSSTQLFLAAVGVFYTIAGVIAGRAALTDAWLSAALDSIGGARDTIATERTWWLVAGAAIVSAGGLLLLVSSRWAVVPFVVSASSQALYLTVLAPRRYDHVDPPSPQGRQQTRNAFWLYVAMTVVVCRAAWIGALDPVSDTGWSRVAGALLLWTVGVAYAARHLIAMSRLPRPEDE